MFATCVTRSYCQSLRCDENPSSAAALFPTFLAATVVRDFGWNSATENCCGEPYQRFSKVSCHVFHLRRLVLLLRYVRRRSDIWEAEEWNGAQDPATSYALESCRPKGPA